MLRIIRKPYVPVVKSPKQNVFKREKCEKIKMKNLLTIWLTGLTVLISKLYHAAFGMLPFHALSPLSSHQLYFMKLVFLHELGRMGPCIMGNRDSASVGVVLLEFCFLKFLPALEGIM